MKKLGKETRKRLISMILLCTLILGSTGVLGDMPAEADGTITLETEQALRKYTDRFLIQYREPATAEENQAFTDRALQQTLKQKKRFSEHLASKENLQKANQLTDGAFRQMPEYGVAVMSEPPAPKSVEGEPVTIDGQEFIPVRLPEKVDPDSYISALEQEAGEHVLSIYPDHPVKLSAQEAAGEMADNAPEALLTPDNTEALTIEQPLPLETESSKQPDTTDSQAPPSIEGPVVVALIDTGVDISHPLLADHMLPGYDFVHNTEEVYRAELGMDQLHGTHLAGIIAAEAPDAKIMPLKCFENEQAYTSDLIRAIQYAKDNGAHIVNCSWGSASQSPLLQNAMADSGLFFVCAAGNNRSDLAVSPVYPASYPLPNSINVASVNGDGGMSYFSNYGATVDIAAPGRNIESTYPDGGTGTMNGTSVSAGFVTGAAASYAAIHGTDGLKNVLTGSADKLSCLENKVQNGNRLNRANLLAGSEGQAITLQPEEDFDVLGLERTPSENWELFAQQDNIQVAALSNQSYFLKSNGSVWTCGNGDPVPKQVAGLLGIISMSVSDHGTLFLSSDGLVHTGPATGGVPMVKDGLSGVNLVAAGDGGQFLVAKNDGTVWGWGQNYCGEAGNSETIVNDGIFEGFVSSNTPSQVTGGVSYPKRLIGGDGVSFAIDQNDTLWQWGLTGTMYNNMTSASINRMEHVRDIAVPSNTFYLGVRTDGTVFYNDLYNGATDLDSNGFADAAYLDHDMMVATNGSVWTWDNTFTVSQIAGIDGVRTISQSPTHTLALKNDGSVWGWGENNKGQLGSSPSDPFFSPVQIGIPVVDTPGTILVDEQYNTTGNPAYHKAQAELEALGWSEYENPEPGGANWQSAAYGEFSAATGQLIMKKTSADAQPAGADSTALVYSLDKTFTKRTDNWQGDDRVSMWKQNFKGKYSIELEGSFPQPNSVVYYDMLGRSSGGATAIVGRYRADWMPNHQFSVYNNGLNGGGVTSYPLWQNADQTKTVTTTFNSFSSTFQTFLNGAPAPSSTTVADAHPKDTFSMSGWNTQQPGAYLTGIRISAQKYAWQNDTVAILNSLKLVEHQAARDVTDDAVEYLTMSMLTDTPAEVQGNLKPLPATLDGASITWTSSHPDLLANDGTLVQGALRPTDVIMTAAIKNPVDGFTQYLDFRLTVTAIGGKVLVEERYGDQNNTAYHLDQSGLEQLGWAEVSSPTGSNEYFQADLGEFSADSGILTMQKTGAVTEPAEASATSLVYGLQKTFTHRADNWKGDPRMSVWTQHFKGDYVVEIDGSFHQSGSQVYYDILGNSSNGTPGIAGRYRVDPGAGANFSVYNNKLNGGGVTSYPLFTNPTQRRVIATQIRSSDSTFQTFVDGSGTPCKTTVAGASPDDTFSMSGWNKANPGEYLTGIRVSAQKQAPAANVIATLHALRLVEAAPQRDIVDDAIDQLSMSILTDTPEAVTEDLKPLPQELAGVPVIWRSSRPDVLSDEGKIVSEIVYDTDVTMTAQLTNPTDKFTKYVDFKLTITMKNGFAEKFDIDVTGTPSANGQPGTTSFTEYPMWTFDYPGLSSGTGSEKHDAQVLVKEGYLTLKKISGRQTDSYGECLTGTRPLSRSQKNPAFRGTAQLTLTSKVQGTGTLRYTVLSDDGRKPFELILDASVKNVRIVYGSDDQGNALTQTLAVDPTVDHTYLLALDTQRGFVLYIDDELIKTETGDISREFLSGSMPKFNLSQLKMWITNITMADTEIGKLKNLIYHELQPLTHAGFQDAEEIRTVDYINGPQTQIGDDYYKFKAEWGGEHTIDFYSQSNQCNITLYDSDYNIIDSSSELSPDNSMRLSGFLDSTINGDDYYYIRVRHKTDDPYTIRIEPSYFISEPNISLNELDSTVHISGGSLLSDTAINLTVFDSENSVAFIANIFTDSYGNYNQVFALPVDAPNGTYQVFVTSQYTNKSVSATFDYNNATNYTPIIKSVLQNKPRIFGNFFDLNSYVVHRTNEDDAQYMFAVSGWAGYTILKQLETYAGSLNRDFQIVMNIYNVNDHSLYHSTSQTITQKKCLELEMFYLEADLPNDYSNYQVQLFLVDGSDIYASYNSPISDTYVGNMGDYHPIPIGEPEFSQISIGSFLEELDPIPAEKLIPYSTEAKESNNYISKNFKELSVGSEIVEDDISSILTNADEINAAAQNMVEPLDNEGGPIIPVVPRYAYYGTDKISYNLTVTVNGKQSDKLIPATSRGEIILELDITNTLSSDINGLSIEYGYFEPTVLENGQMKSAKMTLYRGNCNWLMRPGDNGRITIHIPIKNVGLVAKQYGNLPLYLVVSQTEGTGTFYDVLLCVNAYDGKPNAPYGLLETPYNMKQDTPFEESLAPGGYAYHHFKPRTGGIYVFNSSSSGVQGELYLEDNPNPIQSDYDVDLGGFHMVAELEAGRDYYLKTYNNSEWNRATTMIINNTRTDTAFLKVKTSMYKEPYDIHEINAGNVEGSVSAHNGGTNINLHYIDAGFLDESGKTPRLLGKTIALSYLKTTLKDGGNNVLKELPAEFGYEPMEIKGLKRDGTEVSFVTNDDVVAAFNYPNDSTAGTDRITAMRYINVFDRDDYIGYYILTGLKSKRSAPLLTCDYTLSLKILDQPEFLPSRPDATVAGSSDKNFMVSSGPEGIAESALYRNHDGTYLCAAPVNGMANIYWHHTNQVWRDIYFGALLWNRSNELLEITMHSKNYTNLNKTWEDDLFTELWYNRGAGGWSQNGFETDLSTAFGYAGATYTLQPGKAVWISAFSLPGYPDHRVSATNGIIRLSIKQGNGQYYMGQGLVCKTMAFENEEYLEQIIDWAGYAMGAEAEPDGSSIRGSGNGAMMRVTVKDKDHAYKTLQHDQPYEFVMTGHDSPSLSKEQFLISRYIDSGTVLYTNEKGTANLAPITLEQYNNLDPEGKRGVISRNPNYGVVYRVDIPQFKVPEGARVIGKVKYTPRTNSTYVRDSGDGLHVAVWRESAYGVDDGFTGILTRGRGVPIKNDIESGVYYEFDANVPTDGPVTYYFAGCGMSSMPYQISFEMEGY